MKNVLACFVYDFVTINSSFFFFVFPACSVVTDSSKGNVYVACVASVSVVEPARFSMFWSRAKWD